MSGRDHDDDGDLGGLGSAIPAAFTAAIPKRDEPKPLEAHTFEALKGEHVVVRANGFAYRGTLVGADESELYLRGEMRWVVLPLGTVTDVRAEPLRTRPLGLPPGIGLDEDDGPLDDKVAEEPAVLRRRDLVGEDDE